MSWNPGLNEKQMVSCALAFVSLLPDHGCAVASCLTLLLPRLPTMVDGTLMLSANRPFLKVLLPGILSGNEKSDRHSSVDSAIRPAAEFTVENSKLTEVPSDFL